VQILVTLLFSLTAPMSYLLARRFVAEDFPAVMAGMATALWPLFVIYGRTLYSETTALPLFVAFLASLPRGIRLGEETVPRWRWILSGSLLALCMLVRPMYLIFAPFLPLILMLEDGRLRMVSKRLVLVTLGCVITLAPWSIYASLHAKRMLLLSANGGETLAGGLNPTLLANGYRSYTAPDGRKSWYGPGKWIGESETGFLSPGEWNLPRPVRDQLLLKRTKEWIVENPRSALYLEVAKLGYMWGIYPFWNGMQQTLLGNLPTLFLLLSSFLAMIRFRLFWRQLSMLFALPLFGSAVALISWGSWRFRQPADVGLILLGVFYLLTCFAAHKIRFRWEEIQTKNLFL
jgi:hypothetical protein